MHPRRGAAEFQLLPILLPDQCGWVHSAIILNAANDRIRDHDQRFNCIQRLPERKGVHRYHDCCLSYKLLRGDRNDVVLPKDIFGTSTILVYDFICYCYGHLVSVLYHASTDGAVRQDDP